MNAQPYVALKGITKAFGPVLANDNVELNVHKGEILALLGENGSGKSTLMNILSGIYAPDKGSITIGGEKVKIRSPQDAEKLGIGMIHQHFKLVEALSAQENIVGGLKKGFFLDEHRRAKELTELSAHYGLSINLHKKVYDMSIGEKQTVEIMKAVYRRAKILILDEPTAVLTPQETRRLFDILRTMKADGCAIVIITHKLDEVMEISDKVTVLRKGQSIKTLVTAETNTHELTECMVGHAMDLSIRRTEKKAADKPLLTLSHVTVKDRSKRVLLDDASLEVYPGEILGIAGVAGSGQRELCEAITGMLPSKGEIMLGGKKLSGMTPRSMRKAGIQIGFVPEDRLGMGLVGGMSVRDNAILKSYRSTKGVFIDRKHANELSHRIVEQYNVSTPGVGQIIRRLSGGNIQKILLGRELEDKPELLITAYPVRGLDIGASYYIYDIINREKARGAGVLFIGEDIDVLMALCDRIAVMSDGKLMGVVDAAAAEKEEIGLMMMGHAKEAE
ncbi:MAG: ABC transporter ATP-binding protein [Clostridia bacterium]|nr:ABC transporter ATP-binding protein [Clostridia bacterium]